MKSPAPAHKLLTTGVARTYEYGYKEIREYGYKEIREYGYKEIREYGYRANERKDRGS